MSLPEVYLILDANLLVGYYAPQTFNATSIPAADKIVNIIDSVRKGCSPNIKLLMPEICVAEAQTVLSKYANTKWTGKNKREEPQSIHGATYRKIVKQMRDDLHGGKLIESIPLQRYHVLAKHLITPIDHNLRKPTKDGKNYIKEMGGTDQLICGMAIWMTRMLGQRRVYVVTADYRLAKVLEKAHRVTDQQFENWGIKEMAEENIGFHFSREIYPNVLYLPKSTDAHLRKIFGSWKLPLKKKKPLKYPKIKNNDIEKMVELYKKVGVGRDNLPYSKEMKLLVRQFNDATGHSIKEDELWRILINRLKKGLGRIKK
jgi:hypothetical protein